jgi:hypothetical protein
MSTIEYDLRIGWNAASRKEAKMHTLWRLSTYKTDGGYLAVMTGAKSLIKIRTDVPRDGSLPGWNYVLTDLPTCRRAAVAVFRRLGHPGDYLAHDCASRPFAEATPIGVTKCTKVLDHNDLRKLHRGPSANTDPENFDAVVEVSSTGVTFIDIKKVGW